MNKNSEQLIAGLRFKIYCQKDALRKLHTACLNKNARIKNLEDKVQALEQALKGNSALIAV